MKCCSDKPPRMLGEKTQECVSQGDNTLFSCASVGGAGITVTQTGFANLQALSAGLNVYTGRYGGCQGAPEGYSHICLVQKVFISFEDCFTSCNHILVGR